MSDDQGRLVEALIAPSPEYERLYHTSAVFRQGIEDIARLARTTVVGLASLSPIAEADMAERIRLTATEIAPTADGRRVWI